ncbi:hypothetical protein [Klebsiella pneumoniae]|uniref:hypothetical protein n=1 Tax=Klebsiella pneumoniae TaxID=573 RepID=UPI0007F8B36F|nr:hypothetical protein [Klebsiella pneumoniae]ANN50121.1 hypothetical protein BAU11_00080 [Klebsiella pneumoniae]
MSLAIQKDVDFSAVATGYLPPVTAGVEYFNFFNSEDSLTRNLIPNKPTPAKNGSPLFNTNQSFLLTNLLNFINTGIKLTDEMTIITVAEPTGADGFFPTWSTTGSPITNGGSFTSQSFMRQSATTRNPTLSLSYSTDGFITRQNLSYGVSSGVDNISLRAIASAFSQTAKTSSLYDLTNNKNAQAPLPANGVYGKAGNILLGSHYNAAESSQGNLYAAAIYSRMLSTAEINQVYAALKAYYSKRGISA